MKIKRLLKFGRLPGHWGLTGKVRELAEAEYTLDGEDLEKRKIEINIAEKSQEDIAIDLLAHEVKYGRLSQKELEKQSATIKGEPWVDIKSLETDPENPRYGGVELDWNEAFVRNLELHGYGPNPEDDDTVNAWFNDLCRNIALEAFDGIGDFQERVEDLTPRKPNWHSDAIPIRKSPPLDGATPMDEIADDDL